MVLLVQAGMYGVINIYYTTKDGFYIIQFISEAYMLHNHTQIDGKVISAGELFVRAQYLCSMQKNIGIRNNSHCNRISWF